MRPKRAPLVFPSSVLGTALRPLLGLLGLLPVLAGCPQTFPSFDAGGETGGLRSLPSCVNPLELEGMTGTVSVSIDTTNGEPGRVRLPGPGGSGCTASDYIAPQVVIAYQVPGSGPQSVEVSTVNSGTAQNFDTVIAIRRTCLPRVAGELPDYCFDDESGTREYRSRGAFVAEGGERLYIYVTGYGAMSERRADEGLARLDVTARPISPPTLDEASILITPGAVRVDVRGGDAGRDATGVWLTFHGPAGEQLDINVDGRLDVSDVLTGPFDRPVLGATTFAETATLATTMTGGASEVRVRLVDRAGVLSERVLTVPARIGNVVGVGATCDATNVCSPELACDALMVCTPAPDRVAACAAATPLDLIAPTDGRATTTTRQNVLTSGAGFFSAQCSTFTGGREDLYAVRIPPGRFDVLLTTDSAGTSGSSLLEPDTILYVRRACTDATALSAIPAECNDDIETSVNQRSAVEILDAPSDSTIYAFVEIYNGAPEGDGIRYEIAATLRPVLSTGATCDPVGSENRCELGPCPVATRVCP